MDPAEPSQLRPTLLTSPDEAAFRAARDPVAAVGVALTLAAVLLQTTLYIASALTIQLDALDADGDQTVFSWMASSVTFSAGLACVLLVVSGFGRGRLLLPLAGLVAFLSLDEAIAVHERVGIRAANLFDVALVWGRVLWPAVYLPLLLAVLALLVAVARAAPRETFRLVVVGLGCLGAAVFLEIVSALLTIAAGTVPQVLEVALEEGLELAGWGLIATGLLSWLGSPRRRQGVQPRLVSRA